MQTFLQKILNYIAVEVFNFSDKQPGFSKIIKLHLNLVIGFVRIT